MTGKKQTYCRKCKTPIWRFKVNGNNLCQACKSEEQKEALNKERGDRRECSSCGLVKPLSEFMGENKKCFDCSNRQKTTAQTPDKPSRIWGRVPPTGIAPGEPW